MRWGKSKGTTWRTNLDTWMSRYVRLRDSNEQGYLVCCTCPKVVYFMDADTGHYIGRQYLAVAWNEINCNSQCKYCNRFNEGMKDKYRTFLVEIHGESKIDLLYWNKNSKFDKALVPMLTKRYRDLSYDLLKTKTLEIQPYWATRR